MANEPEVTVVGNLTADPELRFTPSGAAVVNFTVAQTPRAFDRQSNEWKEGETIFMRCSAWRTLAENIAESLKKGNAVVAKGRLKSRTYTANDGTSRTVMELDAEEVGASLKFATVTVQRVERTQQGQGQQAPSQQQGDPWSTSTPDAPRPQRPAQQPQQGGWAGQPYPTDEPPY